MQRRQRSPCGNYYNMSYEDYIPNNREAFIARTKEIARKIGAKYADLMTVMFIESGMNPQAVNKYSGATGLIQFLPSTARSLGTTTDDLLQMSNVEQLDYVEKYFAPYAGRVGDLEDLYFAVFFPAAMGKPDDYILQTKSQSAELIGRQNPVLDTNKDGVISVLDVKQYLDTKRIASGLSLLMVAGVVLISGLAIYFTQR